jgi:hypothetical protein
MKEKQAPSEICKAETKKPPKFDLHGKPKMERTGEERQVR